MYFFHSCWLLGLKTRAAGAAVSKMNSGWILRVFFIVAMLIINLRRIAMGKNGGVLCKVFFFLKKFPLTRGSMLIVEPWKGLVSADSIWPLIYRQQGLKVAYS